MIGRYSTALLAFTLLAGGALPALAQSTATGDDRPATQGDGKDDHRTEKRAGEIVSQPVRDIGIGNKKVPPILATAVESPYAPPRGKGCAGITREMANLNAVLGPDFGKGTEANESKFGKVADVGGSALVNSLIPFRGLVREVSGAAASDRRMAVAVSGGVARRGFLHGLGQRMGCKLP